MNIKEAKEQIKNAMVAYFTKDEYGNYKIPSERQRPVFLMGPPGIGKTAIVEQIAEELGVGFVSYSMTHHTRQSALGLPFIETKVYGGKEYSVSEYTMSEIIASVYEAMEEGGFSEGILFLDEINCVSETLAPSMLQFLQYKIFGRHRVPEGWIVVTAGNPPEYNDSVRNFDIATWDRMKRIDIEPDFDAWKEYAYSKGIHASIMTYLETKRQNFYKIQNTVDGMQFVTARGWDDLSQMIDLCEENDLPVDQNLISQYIQDKTIAKEFAVYYDLFKKYESDYQIDRIIKGEEDTIIRERAKAADFDERLSLLGMLLDAIFDHVREIINTEDGLQDLLSELKVLAGRFADTSRSPLDILGDEIKALEVKADKSRVLNMSREKYNSLCKNIDFLKQEEGKIKPELSGGKTFDIIRRDYNKLQKKLGSDAEETGKYIDNVFNFCEDAFGEGQEILILVTELTINKDTVRFIAEYGCDKYFEHNKELLFYERQKGLIERLETLDL